LYIDRYQHAKSENPTGEWGMFSPKKSYENTMGEKMRKDKFSSIMIVIWDKLSCELLYGINNPYQ
jgi:hypothetical protein